MLLFAPEAYINIERCQWAMERQSLRIVFRDLVERARREVRDSILKPPSIIHFLPLHRISDILYTYLYTYNMCIQTGLSYRSSPIPVSIYSKAIGILYTQCTAIYQCALT